MIELLRFYFDIGIKNESLVLYTMANGLEETGILTRVRVYYEKDTEKKLLAWDSFQEIEEAFTCKLTLAIERKLLLDESLINDIGFYLNQYYKNPKRKNLVYKISEQGNAYWVGGCYSLFDYSDINSWMYNDKQGNIIFALTPMYPNFIVNYEQKKCAISYTQWMKQYQPFFVYKISLDVARQWFFLMNDLNNIVKKISKTLPCEGLKDCACCIYLGKGDA